MGALLTGTQFLFTAVSGSSCRIDVLNCAEGAAEHYWASFFAVDFAEAAVSNWAATNQAVLPDGTAELRCTWFTLIG